MEDDLERIDQLLRWRLVLGAYGSHHLKASEGEEGGEPGVSARIEQSQAMEKTLDFLYDREFAKRAHRQAGPGTGDGLSIPVWLSGIRELFPAEAARVLERDALHRYGLTELVTDPAVLSRAEPSTDLLKAIVQFKHLMKGPVLDVARKKVAEVVEQLRAVLENDTGPALYGPRRVADRAPLRTFRNVDWHRTIRRNLDQWDPDRQQLLADRIHFRHRAHDRSRWRIIVSVDQSGSMTDSLIHSAVMGAIFAGLPAIDVRLVLWDHRIVDASDMVHDPVEVLMQVQLGGGTDFLPALQYCAALVEDPQHTILVVISDFHVWGDRAAILELASDLSGAGVRTMGLCALDTDGEAVFDHRLANQLADRGWFVGALTPKGLAEKIRGFL